MITKPNLIIGIPAHNEQSNISELLLNLCTQQHKNFMLRQIIIVSDGSTDHTEEAVDKLGMKNVRLVVFPRRIGQSASQNYIFSQSRSQYILLLEADTLPLSNNFIDRLMSFAVRHKKTGLIQGNIQHADNNSFIGSVLNMQKRIYHNHTLKYSTIRRWFSSGRGGRLFSKKVYTKLRWPSDVPEDVYAHLWCASRKIKTDFVNNARCVFRCPQSLEDFVKQIEKNNGGKTKLIKYFSSDLVEKVYGRSRAVRKAMAGAFFRENPLYFLVFLFMYIYANMRTVNAEFSDLWNEARSTKKLLHL